MIHLGTCGFHGVLDGVGPLARLWLLPLLGRGGVRSVMAWQLRYLDPEEHPHPEAGGDLVQPAVHHLQHSGP